jgi:hypothetical protein
VSTAIQAGFVFLFGAMTAYLTAPWRWLMSLLPRKRAAATDNPEEAVESPPEKKRRAA